MRRIRKITLFACTACFSTFPSSKAAKTHAAEHPPTPKSTKGRRVTQTGQILEAVRGGAKTAQDVHAKTKIPLTRVHSLLSYHRSRGNLKGHTGQLRAV